MSYLFKRINKLIFKIYFKIDYLWYNIITIYKIKKHNNRYKYYTLYLFSLIFVQIVL